MTILKLHREKTGHRKRWREMSGKNLKRHIFSSGETTVHKKNTRTMIEIFQTKLVIISTCRYHNHLELYSTKMVSEVLYDSLNINYSYRISVWKGD